MMEQIIAIINTLSFVILTVSLSVVIVKIRNRKLPGDTGIFLTLMIASIMFINFSNILEHLGITARLDYYEDFMDILITLLFIVFLNSIRLHADIERRAENERALTAMLDERNELLKEIHHRVKNNLQLVISIMSLQRRHHDMDEKLEQILMATENRIFSMAAIHETVYQASSFTNIPAGGFIRTIAFQAFQNLKDGCKGRIGMVYDIDSGIAIRLEIAVPLGLLVNELVSNAVQHAFIGRECGTVTLKLFIDEAAVVLEVIDDGIGMQASPGPDAGDAITLGSILIKNLVSQIDGTMDAAVNGGTRITIRFPQ